MPLPSSAAVDRVTLTDTLTPSKKTSAQLKTKQCQKLAELRLALVAGGFDTASKQAAALGLSRSSAWKVLQGDHKQSGLSASTINRMLTSPHLPAYARKIILEYVREKLRAEYGHGAKALKHFRVKLRGENLGTIEPEVREIDLSADTPLRA